MGVPIPGCVIEMMKSCENQTLGACRQTSRFRIKRSGARFLLSVMHRYQAKFSFHTAPSPPSSDGFLVESNVDLTLTLSGPSAGVGGSLTVTVA